MDTIAWRAFSPGQLKMTLYAERVFMTVKVMCTWGCREALLAITSSMMIPSIGSNSLENSVIDALVAQGKCSISREHYKIRYLLSFYYQ